MPALLVTVNNRSQYFSLGKTLLSPIKKGPLDGVRTNKICPPLAFILSVHCLTWANMESNLLPETGGSLLNRLKNIQMPLTLFCSTVSATKLSVMYSCLLYFTLPKPGGKSGNSNTPCLLGIRRFDKCALSDNHSLFRNTRLFSRGLFKAKLAFCAGVHSL